MVSPGDCEAGGEKNGSIQEWDGEGVNWFDAGWGSGAGNLDSWGESRMKEGSEEGEKEYNF